MLTRVNGLPRGMILGMSGMTGRMNSTHMTGVMLLKTAVPFLNVSCRGVRSDVHRVFRHGKRTVMSVGLRTLRTNGRVTRGLVGWRRYSAARYTGYPRPGRHDAVNASAPLLRLVGAVGAAC